jgi:L-iditol 2-dehydrogenase
MKALRLDSYGTLRVVDIDVPAVAADEVLVRVKACGICGSDVHGYTGITGRRIPTLVMGHEAAGTVESVGAGVRDLAAGGRVTFDSTIYCGACASCRRGAINLCERRMVLGVSCGEYRRDGAFAEFVAVPARIVHRLPDGLPFEHAAMAEALAVALHAIERKRPAASDRVGVIGCGMIGLLTLQALRAVGCRSVAAVDPDPARRTLAERLGAGSTHEDADALHNLDHCFEAVGSAVTPGAAIRAVRKAGAVTLIGNLAPEAPLPLQAVVTRELTLYGSCASSGEYPWALDLLASGAVQVAPLISAVAPLEDGQHWFDRLHRGGEGLMKVVLTP